MSSILLSDPMLQWLDPLQLHKLRCLTKESKDVIDTYEETKRSYKVQSYPGVGWRKRERLYALYPKIENLTIHSKNIYIPTYLRPKIQDLHLVVTLSLNLYVDTDHKDPLSIAYDHKYLEHLINLFKEVKNYCEQNTDCHLKRLTISYAPEVKISYIIPSGTRLVNNTDTPLQKDKKGILKCSIFPPNVCLKCINSSDPYEADDTIVDLIIAMCEMFPIEDSSGKYRFNKLKSIRVPKSFPVENDSITGTPGDFFYVEETDGIYDFVGESVNDASVKECTRFKEHLLSLLKEV